MAVFSDYAHYYNLLYEDKDYAAEADYVDRLIQEFHPGAKTILDLGCGTGRHDFLLAEKGYDVTGVDRSEEMLAEARDELTSLGLTKPKQIVFHHGDIREVRLGKTFDVVAALFHVVSYQPTNLDLKRAFETAAVHLNPRGIFIFDCWYGPGVLTDPPRERVKEIEDARMTVKRIAQPIMRVDENMVEVHYHVFIRDKTKQQLEEVRECHRMRYLFKPEVEMLLEVAGFEMVGFMEFMKTKPPEQGKWNVCFVGRKMGQNMSAEP